MDTRSGAWKNTSWLSASAIYQTLNVLTEVYRPGEESGWKHFDSAQERLPGKRVQALAFAMVGLLESRLITLWQYGLAMRLGRVVQDSPEQTLLHH